MEYSILNISKLIPFCISTYPEQMEPGVKRRRWNLGVKRRKWIRSKKKKMELGAKRRR